MTDQTEALIGKILEEHNLNLAKVSKPGASSDLVEEAILSAMMARFVIEAALPKFEEGEDGNTVLTEELTKVKTVTALMVKTLASEPEALADFIYAVFVESVLGDVDDEANIH